MRPADHARPARRRLAYLAILAVAGVTALMLSQCKLVDERLTGVSDAFQIQPASCILDCVKAADQAIRAEADRYNHAVQQCHGDPACLAAEAARHLATAKQIIVDRDVCLGECHHQGGGEGGR